MDCRRLRRFANNRSKTVEKTKVKKGHNGRKLLRRLKPTVGCKANKRRRISK
jgi:hypothetical protein